MTNAKIIVITTTAATLMKNKTHLVSVATSSKSSPCVIFGNGEGKERKTRAEIRG